MPLSSEPARSGARPAQAQSRSGAAARNYPVAILLQPHHCNMTTFADKPPRAETNFAVKHPVARNKVAELGTHRIQAEANTCADACTCVDTATMGPMFRARAESKPPQRGRLGIQRKRRGCMTHRGLCSPWRATNLPPGKQSLPTVRVVLQGRKLQRMLVPAVHDSYALLDRQGLQLYSQPRGVLRQGARKRSLGRIVLPGAPVRKHNPPAQKAWPVGLQVMAPRVIKSARAQSKVMLSSFEPLMTLWKERVQT